MFVSELRESKDQRPFVLCEYAYSKSNSNGDLLPFWTLVHRFERLQGGFVWDFQDKALTVVTSTGKRNWGYGGDFGEPVVDPVPDMCLNGVVQPDLAPHPGALEIKQVQAPLSILCIRPGIVPFCGQQLLSLLHARASADFLDYNPQRP